MGNIKTDDGKICCGYMYWYLDTKKREASQLMSHVELIDEVNLKRNLLIKFMVIRQQCSSDKKKSSC